MVMCCCIGAVWWGWPLADIIWGAISCAGGPGLPQATICWDGDDAIIAPGCGPDANCGGGGAPDGP